MKNIKEIILDKNEINKVFFDEYGVSPKLELFFPFEIKKELFCWEENYGKEYVLKNTKLLFNKIKESEYGFLEVDTKVKEDGVLISFFNSRQDIIDNLYENNINEFMVISKDFELKREEIKNLYNKNFFIIKEEVSLYKGVYFNLLNNEEFEDFMPLLDVAECNLYPLKTANKQKKTFN